MPGCIFAPYFPPEEPQKFANVHKIFGASNVTKLLNELMPHQREDAVNSLAYEAEARVRDPVYGCVGAISFLQRQVDRLQKELDAANADLIRFAYNEMPMQGPANHMMTPGRGRMVDYNRRYGGDGGGSGGGYYQTPNFPFQYQPFQWNDHNYNPHGNGGI